MAARLTRLARPLSHLRPSPSSSPSILPSYVRPLSQTSNRASPSDPAHSPSSSVGGGGGGGFGGFGAGPAPPRLPAEEQAEFERLQRIAGTQEGFNPTSTPDFSTLVQKATEVSLETGEQVSSEAEATFTSTPLRKGAPPEFEGDVNPRTGEVGGPKNDPLRWGAGGDYSFNGRVTDF